MRVCTCDLCCAACDYTPDQCHPCWLWHNRAAHRVAWGGPPDQPDPPNPSADATPTLPPAAPYVPPQPPRWVPTASLAADSSRLAGRLPPDVSGVVGVPRSGMIPAAVIATALHLPLYELADDGPRLLSQGARGRYFGLAGGGGPLAVVDDTVSRGSAMRRARAALRGRPALYGAVYVLPESTGLVDFYHEVLPDPHLLEWNLFNSWMASSPEHLPFYGGGVAVDFDGVLCHDEESGGVVGTPYLLPRASPCRLIVTGRPEAYRPQTEEWLRRWGVRWEQLEMLPNDVPFTPGRAAAHKARHFTTSPCGVFVESDPEQALLISTLSKKSVVCPRTGVVHAAAVCRVCRPTKTA